MLIQEGLPPQNLWGIKLTTMFHMANDSHLFRSRDQLETEGWSLDGNIFRKNDEEYLPLIEGKMFMPFDHRFANVLFTDNMGRHGQPQLCQISDRLDPTFVPTPEYWVHSVSVAEYKESIGLIIMLPSRQ